MIPLLKKGNYILNADYNTGVSELTGDIAINLSDYFLLEMKGKLGSYLTGSRIQYMPLQKVRVLARIVQVVYGFEEAPYSLHTLVDTEYGAAVNTFQESFSEFSDLSYLDVNRVEFESLFHLKGDRSIFNNKIRDLVGNSRNQRWNTYEILVYIYQHMEKIIYLMQIIRPNTRGLKPDQVFSENIDVNYYVNLRLKAQRLKRQLNRER